MDARAVDPFYGDSVTYPPYHTQNSTQSNSRLVVHESEAVWRRQLQLYNDPHTPQRNSVWRHYKGNLYVVHSISMHSASEEFYISYSLLGGDLRYPWCRPLREWYDQIETESGVIPRYSNVAGVKIYMEM